MTAVEKIAERILQNAELEGKAIVDDAVEKAKLDVDAKRLEIKALLKEQKAKSDLKAERVVKSAESSAELTVRNAMLKKRREEIEKTLLAVEEYFGNLSDGEYFAALESLAKANALKLEGTMVLNSKDLARMQKSFEESMKSLGLSISAKADDNIGAGFILKYNDIEINNDLKAIIAEKRELLEDTINAALF